MRNQRLARRDDRQSYFLTDLIDPLPVTLDDLAYKVRRLVPSSRNPERFHEDKSEIVAELSRLAQRVRRHG